MSYAAHDRDLTPCFGQKISTSDKDIASRPGVLRRVLNRMLDGRQRQADREIARFLNRSGGRLTDEMEREMTQRLFRGNWNPRSL